MAVEVGGRWQVVCRHGVGDAMMFARRSDCVRLAGLRANCEWVRISDLVEQVLC
jgi:hypothetical protein